MGQWDAKSEKSLDDQITACQKSLEKAKRSGRENIAQVLQAKLESLLQPAGHTGRAGKAGARSGKKGNPDKASTGEDRKKKSLKLKSKRITIPADSIPDLGSDTAPESPRKSVARLRKKRKRAKAEETDRMEEQGPRKLRKTREKAKGKLPGLTSGSKSSLQSAVDILLRASAKARAARRAEGEDSEEELQPCPDFPIAPDSAGKSLGEADDVELEDGQMESGEEEDSNGAPDEVVEERPVKTAQAGARKADTAEAVPGDEASDDFFDAASEGEGADDGGEVSNSASAEGASGSRPGASGVRRREKKLRRKERLEGIRQRSQETHPSWVAAKTARVSGTLVKQGKSKMRGRRRTFVSETEDS
ncbi:unnamed protein product [Polarella glacialis]|uniref:Uncharacterized protein n=1 Tax=Polarella glacialis TaxID=89957 RepID=A0A813LNZ7_POLGL|nr:unnamed protein product [Polarella glacialis]